MKSTLSMIYPLLKRGSNSSNVMAYHSSKASNRWRVRSSPSSSIHNSVLSAAASKGFKATAVSAMTVTVASQNSPSFYHCSVPDFIPHSCTEQNNSIGIRHNTLRRTMRFAPAACAACPCPPRGTPAACGPHNMPLPQSATRIFRTCFPQQRAISIASLLGGPNGHERCYVALLASAWPARLDRLWYRNSYCISCHFYTFQLDISIQGAMHPTRKDAHANR